MQASLVCRRLATAVTEMPVLTGTFILRAFGDSYPSYRFPGRLDTKLLLSWAKHIKALDVTGGDVTIPGLAGFVAAASALRKVELAYLADSEAAKADVIFQGSTSIRSMSIVGGSSLPCLWPLGMEHASIQLEDMLEDHQTRDRHAAEELLLHGVLCSLMRLPSLSSLHLNIDHMGNLQSGVMLAHLQWLSVTMWLDKDHAGRFDLGFLAVQPCDVLDLTVFITVLRPELQQGLIDELRQQEVILNRIDIITDVPIPPVLLAQWKGVCTDHLELAEQFGECCKTVLIEDGFDSD